jgi:hypothetical protein
MAHAFQLPAGSQEFHKEFKKRNSTSSVRASLAIRRKLTLLDWLTGEEITKSFERKEQADEVTDRAPKVLKIELAGLEGFSPQNFSSIRFLAEGNLEPEILRHVIAELPSGHNVCVLGHVEDRPTREWNLQSITTKILRP